MLLRKISARISSVCFEYKTLKIVTLKSKLVGLINRFIQLAIIIYVIGWVLVWNKGYQQFSSIDSSVTTKLKGVVLTNFSSEELNTSHPEEYNRLWDVAEYVIPPQENGAFFVLTNAIITPNQKQGICPEANVDGAHCTSDDNCAKGFSLPKGKGVFTGKCDTIVGRCLVYAWCPVEENKLPLSDRPLLGGSEKFTVLIKNNVEFPLWKVKTCNIASILTASYLNNCRYNADTDPRCPIFQIGSIVNEAGNDYTKLATNGGVIAITIKWDCNLDYSVKYCLPSYSFRRLDDPEALTAKGWNFRFARYFDNGATRTLYKAYGILFVIIVEGRAGKFSTIPLLRNLGSGLALLSVAIIICDLIVLHLTKNRSFYKEMKYLIVDTAPMTDRDGPYIPDSQDSISFDVDDQE